MHEDVHPAAVTRRQAWLAVLAGVPTEQLHAAWCALSSPPNFQIIRGAEVGMVMVRARIGGTGDAFNFAEATVTRCALQADGGALGVGYTLGRDVQKAELIARFDALLQDEAWQARLLANPVSRWQSLQAQAALAQRHAAAVSRVDFLTVVRGDT